MRRPSIPEQKIGIEIAHATSDGDLSFIDGFLAGGQVLLR
jgi:hypothetical protein